MIRVLTCLVASVALVACEQAEQRQIGYRVAHAPFSVVIPARGELTAAAYELLTAPGKQPMTIEWMLEENAEVRAGDLVIRFDGTDTQRELRKTRQELDLLREDQSLKDGELQNTQTSLNLDVALTDAELSMSEQYTIDDVLLFSKLEIAEKFESKAFITSKKDFLDWRLRHVTKEHDGERSVLESKEVAFLQRLKEQDSALQQLELRSPYAGRVSYMKNWQGDKPLVGQIVFPGTPLASLPDISSLQAKVFVLMNQAHYVTLGQHVDIAFDALPQNPVRGEVVNIAQTPQTLEKGDPTLYTEVIVSLPELAAGLLPGSQLTASIIVSPERTALKIPAQAVVNAGQRAKVTQLVDGKWQDTAVQIGQRGPHFVEITSGVQPGDVVSLMPQMGGPE